MKLALICLFAIFAYVQADESGATSLKEDNDPHIADGVYKYVYETSNGIKAEETGSLIGAGEEAGSVQVGSFSYTAPDGSVISVRYRADENGFQPEGAHLPK